MLRDFLYEWQTLIGAFLGAATPISLWFLTEWYQSREKQKEHLYRLEKFLVYSINNAIDAHETTKYFIENRLMELINNINERTKNDIYSVDTAFLPLLSMHNIDENLLNINTGSNYIDNELFQVFKMSKDFAIGIDDLRQQFMNTIQVNREMSFKKLNSPKIQNEAYKINIQDFINTVNRDFFDKNVKIYIQSLVSTRVGLNTLRDMGIIRWQIKFGPDFKYFKNKQNLKKFYDNTHEHINTFLKEKVDIEVKKIESSYK